MPRSRSATPTISGFFPTAREAPSNSHAPVAPILLPEASPIDGFSGAQGPPRNVVNALTAVWSKLRAKGLTDRSIGEILAPLADVLHAEYTNRGE